MDEEQGELKVVSTRSEWDIKDDVHSVKRAIEIFKDKARLKDVQEHIKKDKKAEATMDLIADGKLSEALGF